MMNVLMMRHERVFFQILQVILDARVCVRVLVNLLLVHVF